MVCGLRILIMKPNFIGLESTLPLVGASNGFHDELSAAPSFDLPSNVDVSWDFC